jgi:hypothetical protein
MRLTNLLLTALTGIGVMNKVLTSIMSFMKCLIWACKIANTFTQCDAKDETLTIETINEEYYDKN